jgi:hypothetical protein
MNRSRFIPQPKVIYRRTKENKTSGMRMTGVHDERLIRREWYNPNKFKVVLHMMQEQIPYIKNAGITPGWKIVTIEPDGFAIVTHGFYKIVEPNDEMITLITNFGKSIGIGNKLPSKLILEKGDEIDARET